LTLCNAVRHNQKVIRSFKDKETERVWQGKRSRRLSHTVQASARRKLRMLNNAQSTEDLRIPPANRLEALKGNRRGQHSIRINNQWRVCFVWRDGEAYDVEVVDYH
jgi:proteic killer suppression protein